MESELITFLYFGLFFLIILLFALLMWYYEEKNKCKHIWEEQNRSNWKRASVFSDSYGDLIKVELKCKKCGDIKVVEI